MAALVNLRILALTMLPVLGQTMESPRTSLVFHSASHSLRPIVGMTGSSYLGSAHYTDLDFASIAPNQQTAIIATGGRVQLIRNIQGPDALLVTLDDAIADVDRVLWSGDSATAILFSSASSRLQWVTGGQANSIASLPETLRVLAADASAKTAIAAAGGRLYKLTPESAPVQIGVLSNPTAAVFHGDEHIFYVSDTATHQILQFRESAGSFTQQVVVEATKDIVALAMSADGKTLYAADKSTRAIYAYQTTDGTLATTLALDWVPSSFDVLAMGTFLLNPDAKAGEPFSVLSTRSGLAELFIPTGAAQ